MWSERESKKKVGGEEGEVPTPERKARKREPQWGQVEKKGGEREREKKREKERRDFEERPKGTSEA